MSVLRSLLFAFVAVFALTLQGCNGGDGSALGVAVVGQSEDPFAKTDDMSPARRELLAATAEGLVSFDEQGRVVPALADRWIVTDDGLSYIFRLRDGNWSNGDPITARSGRLALQAALRAQRGKPLGRDFAVINEVRAMASRVIEIRLVRPSPYLLQLLAQPELGLFHDDRGSGPMTAVRKGRAVMLAPMDPSSLGQPEVADWASRARRLGMAAMPAAAAVERFNAGQVDLVLGGRLADFPLTRSVGILRGTIQLDPVVGLFGLQIMNDKGFLASPQNREALAMAIDRGKLMSVFGLGGWQSTSRVVAPGLDGDSGPDAGTPGERWQQQTIEDRRATASQRVRQWMAAQLAPATMPKSAAGASTATATGPVSQAAPAKGPHLTLWLPAGEGSDMLFTGIASDLAAIGVSVTRAAEEKGADLALFDSVARYPQAQWFLDRLSCKSSSGLCSPTADALVEQANATSDSAQRAILLAQAESELTNANVYIPFGPPIRWSLVRGSVNGFAPNAWGWHPLLPLAWLPK